VTSLEEGEPLIGVTVVIQNTSAGTVTDYEGNYSINVNSPQDTLVFSYIGYQSQQVAAGVSNQIDIQLAQSAESLEEVVVVGYGTMRKSDLTGSVFSLEGKEINQNPDANALQGLQGKVPGVQVSSPSGNPGENPVVRIRGVATFLGGASPIFVVDGVITNDISFLNSGDIQSVEVLKDASATAIYGTRGANGVIIITTKTGQSGKPVVNFNATYSQEFVHQKIDLLGARDFAQVVNEIQPGTFNNLDALSNTDWQEEVINDGAGIQKYELSVSGGSDKYNYYFGGSYFDQTGVLEKSDYQRYSLKLNNNLQAASFLNLGTNLTFAKEDKNNPPGVVATAYRAWPTSTPTDANGNFVEVEGSGNPIAAIEFTNNFDDRIRALGNLYADLTFLRDFTFRTSYQLDWRLRENTAFSPVFFVSPQQQNEMNNLSKARDISNTWIFENTLTYKKDFGNHRFNVLGGYTTQEFSAERFSASIENLIREEEEFWYIDAGDITTLNANNSEESFSYISYLFRLNYSFAGKYLFTGTFRRDGSSKFGPENRWGNFPSLALGWRLSEEPFLAGVESLDNLKLRVSWGINGNDQIPFNGRFARVGSNSLEAVFGPNEELVPGATLTDAGNSSLQWENTESYDIGLEFSFLSGRLTGEIDYYNKQTDQVLVSLLLPAHFGNGAFNRVVFNAADVENSGFEFFLNYSNSAGAFTYDLGINASTVNNEVLSVGAADEFIQDGSLNNGQLVTRTQQGLPVGAFFGYKTVGVFQNEAELNQFPTLAGQQVGDFIYQDTDNNGTITPDDRVVLGSYIPDYLFGFNANIGYKGFGLQLFFQGQVGNEIYNGKRAVRPELYNFESFVLDRWTGEGSTNSQPRLTNAGLNYSPSDWFIEDGSFLRLRTVTLSYQPSQAFLRGLGLASASVFLRGTNVYTFTEYSGYSPEIASQNVLSSGIDLGLYPITAVYSAGLSFSF
jgi:TonB-linked SusC/RagA family outer membrane protein